MHLRFNWYTVKDVPSGLFAQLVWGLRLGRFNAEYIEIWDEGLTCSCRWLFCEDKLS